jgi:hypothetical protein
MNYRTGFAVRDTEVDCLTVKIERKWDLMPFIQLVEVVTSRRDEIEALVSEWKDQTEGRRMARRGTLTEDRDRPGTFVQIVEFDSYEAAMENSALPETSMFAGRLAKLSDQPPIFRNLDVIRVEDL